MADEMRLNWLSNSIFVIFPVSRDFCIEAISALADATATAIASFLTLSSTFFSAKLEAVAFRTSASDVS